MASKDEVDGWKEDYGTRRDVNLKWSLESVPRQSKQASADESESLFESACQVTT